MTLIALRSIDKFYGGRAVLRGLEMDVGPGARIGLVGPNGAGKSTLLRVLAGLEAVDDGEINRRRGIEVAYLPQRVEGDGRTPPEVLRGARPELDELAAEIKECEALLGAPEVASDLRRMQRVLERHGQLLQRFTELGGQGFEGEARGRLRALGLEEDDLGRPTSALSGGQRKLVALAACLVRRPDVLLLDEPETHLDADRRERLGTLIRGFDGTVVVVSHDRYFLDRLAEVRDGELHRHEGGYTAWRERRETRRGPVATGTPRAGQTGTSPRV